MCKGYEQTSKQTKIIYKADFKQVEVLCFFLKYSHLQFCVLFRCKQVQVLTTSTIKLKPRDEFH